MRLLPAGVVVLLFALGMRYASKAPPRSVPRTSPDSVFSAERAMDHVREMARAPRMSGTAEHGRVRGYLVEQLNRLGLEVDLQGTTALGTRYPVAGRVINVVGRLRGSTDDRRAVLLVAHYDGVGAGPAAGDDASGSAVLLETVRALKAGSPTRHDVMVLFTDSEEIGLLGAAAFAREHRWAKDVQVILNFEARGTGGQAVMFQTGRDNLDQIRLLRGMPDVAATSLAATVYQFLPNDTDLTELFALDTPALNFAFADGVERYHTAQDDVAHLDPGSIQQEGGQALGLTRLLAAGPLPRPATGNAVFFDLPLLGLVYYPESWARPLSVLGLLLASAAFVVGIRRQRPRWRPVVLGLVGMLLSLGMGGGLAYLATKGTSDGLAVAGPRGLLGLGIAALALGGTAVCWAVARRWAEADGLGLVPLLVWTGLAVAASFKLPGVSFLPLWPAVAAALVALAWRGSTPRLTSLMVGRIPTAVVAFLIVPMVVGMALVAVPVNGPGAIVIGVLTPLIAWLLAGDVELLAGNRRWWFAAGSLIVGAILVVSARWVAGRNLTFPERTSLLYTEAADGTNGWLAAGNESATDSNSWVGRALGGGARPVSADSTSPAQPAPSWLVRFGFGGTLGAGSIRAAPAPRAGLNPPSIAVLSDSVADGKRAVEYLVRPGAGQMSLTMRAVGAEVVETLVDGKRLDAASYRRRFAPRGWMLLYTAPADSGFRLRLTMAGNRQPTLEVLAQGSGLPPAIAAALPPRPSQVVTSQFGDLTAVYRRFEGDPPVLR